MKIIGQKTFQNKDHLSSKKKKKPTPVKESRPDHGPITSERILAITCYGGVIKSWRLSQRKCSGDAKSESPQLVQISGKIPSKYDQENGTSRSHIWTSSFEYHRQGHMVAMEANLFSSCFWESTAKCVHHLSPVNPDIPLKYDSLRLPNDPNVHILAVTGSCCPAFTFLKRDWHYGKSRIEQDCTLKDRYGRSQHIQFCNVITFQNKFYALSLQGSLVVIENIDSCFRITGIGGNRGVPSSVCKHFREYLVELNGEIMLVFLLSRKSIDVVEEVEVFRLDIPKLLWVKVESLGGGTLVLKDGFPMTDPARKLGSKKNCIYFSYHRENEWWIFDMVTGVVSPGNGSNTKITE